MPLAILASRNTTGSLEWLAASLQRNGRAILVGDLTPGRPWGYEGFEISGEERYLLVPNQILSLEPGKPLVRLGCGGRSALPRAPSQANLGCCAGYLGWAANFWTNPSAPASKRIASPWSKPSQPCSKNLEPRGNRLNGRQNDEFNNPRALHFSASGHFVRPKLAGGRTPHALGAGIGRKSRNARGWL